jgi:hypothetical protein
MLAAGRQPAEVARLFGVTYCNMHRLARFKTYQYIPCDDETRRKIETSLSPDRPDRRNTNAKLHADQVRTIKTRLLAGEGCTSIARDYGVNDQTIRLIRQGKNWRHVRPAEPPPATPESNPLA